MINRAVFCLLCLAIPLTVAARDVVDEGKWALKLTPLRPQACYAPGTPDAYIREQMNQQMDNLLQNSLSGSFRRISGVETILESDDDRWSSTATNGSGLGQGDPITLTWSMLPDGISIPSAFDGDETSDSNLQAYLDSIYGSSATWLPIFTQMFDRWSELTGIIYEYEPYDDGAVFPSSPGVLYMRGDVRIGGHPIDGDSGILAYNYFPGYGDMVIDSPDDFYLDTGNNSLKLRNVLAHEHGHGLGLSHTCPSIGEKLMEPFISTLYDGPQHDDILDANRAYGDVNESNDSAGEALVLAGIEENLSIDDVADEDYFVVNVVQDSFVSATLTPTGSEYLKGPQYSDGNCTQGTIFDSLTRQNLTIELLDTDGMTVLATADQNGPGGVDSIVHHVITTPGTYFLRVSGGPLAVAQLYSLQADLVALTNVCGDDGVLIDGLDVPDGEDFSCTANSVLTLKNATFRGGSTGILTAPDIVLDDNVSVEPGATLDAGQ